MNLLIGETNPDRNGFELMPGPITHKKYGWDWLLCVRNWRRDGGWFFTTVVIGWWFRFYVGKYKLDASRTLRYWWGEFNEEGDPPPDPNLYVFNTKSVAERFSVRFHGNDFNADRWDGVSSI